MNSNIFIVHTEYHLMISINLIISRYNDAINNIYITDGHRIRNNLQFVGLNANIHRIAKKDYGTSKFLKELLYKNPTNFFFFQQVSSDNMFLAYEMHHHGVNVVLMQDGLRAYELWNRKNIWVHILLDTITFHWKMIKRKTFIPYFRMNNLSNYGGWTFVDELGLTIPDHFVNQSNKCIRKIPDFSKNVLKILGEIFHVNDYSIDPQAIMIIGQPKLQEYWDREVEILKAIVDKFPNRNIYFKPHPNTKEGQLNLIKTIRGIQIVNYPIPVELFIMQMKNTCIISSHSTALLTNNSSCKFYWIYKMYGNGGRLFSQVKIVNPTSHIKEIESLDEIEY